MVCIKLQDGVYDITDFVDQHPGGANRIMLAAGGSVDSFWAMYAQHQKQEVYSLLEAYRIGSLVRNYKPPLIGVPGLKVRGVASGLPDRSSLCIGAWTGRAG